MKEKHTIDWLKIVLAVLSGFLLTGSFPRIGISWLAWIALVPLLLSLRGLSLKRGFYLGFLTGFIHYLTLIGWLVGTMQTYGHLPMLLGVLILILLSAYLALYVASFSAILSWLSSRPAICLILIPVLWVSLEYIRSFLFTGFPWELIGNSQFNHLHLIQISDILGVYGTSFWVALSNAVIFLVFLCLTGKDWQGAEVTRNLAAGAILTFAIIISLVWAYGNWRIKAIDRLAAGSPSAIVTVVQGNIDQAIKWDPAFQRVTTEKYINLSQLAKEYKPDLVVWPETATPFYFLDNIELSNMVQKGIADTGASFLIGSPSFARKDNIIKYYNSAYLIGPDGKPLGKYDKVHLVPFGEYIPLHNWFPFLGKMVKEVGDFWPGQKGNVIKWGNYRLGVLICYEIIFPNLSRALVNNKADLLINITNDAWYGRTGAPYQHFSMAVFRAVENRRALVRSANTGISGFIDPVGRIIAETNIFEDAVMTHSVPVIHRTTFYTRWGDLFAMICLAVTVLAGFRLKVKDKE